MNNIYLYGSHVYGTNNEYSDKDYICVNENQKEDVIQKNINGNDFNIYSLNHFKEKLENHDITILECIFLNDNFKEKEEIKLEFILNKTKLRDSISKTSSNSFVKAKKKLTIEKDLDPLIAKKSLFHSLRILIFGIQIAEKGKIYDYTEANKYYKEIFKDNFNNWEQYKEKYQPIYNTLKTKFKIVCPKDE